MDDVASVVAQGSSAEVSRLLRSLSADPSKARKVLADLSSDSRAEVRGWVPFAARKVLGRQAVPYLVALARDRNPGVSDVALEELLDLEPEAAKTLIKLIRAKLRSKDPQESIFAMWTLAQLGDRDSIDAIRRLSELSEFPFQRRAAEVVLLLLEAKIDGILGRIREHDHEYMRDLAHAAMLAGGHEALEAVKECAENAPDADCRHYCQWNLSQPPVRRVASSGPAGSRKI
jgi:HEAT repeat protein